MLYGDSAAVLGAAELPDGRIVTWARDHLLRVWAADGTPVAVLAGHAKGVRGVQVLRDGRLLSWSVDGTARTWDTEGHCLATMLVGVAAEDERDDTAVPVVAVRDARELPDGRIVAWDDRYDLSVWDTGGACIGRFDSIHELSIVDVKPLTNGGWVAWTAEGRLLLVHGNRYLRIAEPPKHRGQLRGVTRLEDGRLLGWTDAETLRVLDGHTGMPLGEFDAVEASNSVPEVYLAWRAAVGATAVLATAGVEGASDRATLRLGTTPSHLGVHWYATGSWSAEHLHPDGTVVARNGRDVAALQLFEGNRRVSAAEAGVLGRVPSTPSRP
jgi:WD40 repeat protein